MQNERTALSTLSIVLYKCFSQDSTILTKFCTHFFSRNSHLALKWYLKIFYKKKFLYNYSNSLIARCSSTFKKFMAFFGWEIGIKTHIPEKENVRLIHMSPSIGYSYVLYCTYLPFGTESSGLL